MGVRLDLERTAEGTLTQAVTCAARCLDPIIVEAVCSATSTSERRQLLASSGLLEVKIACILSELRRVEHARLLLSYITGVKDVRELKLDPERLNAMIKQRVPLGFASAEQFKSFCDELAKTLGDSGISGNIRIIGTSTSLFTLNPDKPVEHYFDADVAAPSDLDLGIECVGLQALLRAHEIAPVSSKLTTAGTFKGNHLRAHIPGLDVTLTRWSDILRRTVQLGAPADGQPLQFTHVTNFVVPFCSNWV